MESIIALIEQSLATPEDLGIEWTKEEIENIPAWIRRSDPIKARKMADEMKVSGWGTPRPDRKEWVGKEEETPAFQRKAGVSSEADLKDLQKPAFKRAIGRKKRAEFQADTGLNIS